MYRTGYRKGFTLIELLFVIAIISLLSSIVIATTSQARAKALDAKKVATVSTTRTALAVFYEDKGRMPYNYSCTNSVCSASSFVTTPAVEGTPAYNASMQELVDAGLLSEIPYDENGESYLYYNNNGKAIFMTRLQNAQPANVASQQCTWQDFSNFDQSIRMVSIGHPYSYNSNLSYFINSVECFESTIVGQNSVPNPECSNMIANPINEGKCFLRKKQTIIGGYQTVTYFDSYSGTCLGPVVQSIFNNPPVTLANFGLSQASFIAFCSRDIDYCVCYPN